MSIWPFAVAVPNELLVIGTKCRLTSLTAWTDRRGARESGIPPPPDSLSSSPLKK